MRASTSEAKAFDHFIALSFERAQPAFLPERKRRLKVWSTGGAMGEEPFGIASYLVASFPVARHLVPGGYLLVGHAETLNSLKVPFQCEPPGSYPRACLKIAWGPAARDFDHGQGGEAGASPRRAVTAEPTRAMVERPAARRVVKEKAAWLRCSSVGDRCGYPPSSRLASRPFSSPQDAHGIFRQALKR